ncbi:MAG: sugar transferase [Candidatus Spechtbacterales bacterium]
MRKNDLITNVLLVPLDFVLLMAAALSAYFLRISPAIEDIKPVLFELPLRQFIMLGAGASIVLLVIFAISGLYTIRRTTPVIHEITKVIISVSAGMAIIIVAMFFNRAWFDSRFILLADWIFAISFISIGRISMRGVRRYLLHKKGIGKERFLMIGSGKDSHLIKEQIINNKKLDLSLVKTLKDPDLNVIKAVHEKYDLHRVLATDSDFNKKEMMKVVNFCEENGIQFSYIPDMFGAIVADMSFDILDDMPVVSIRPSPLDGWKKILKRSMDIIAASFLLFVFSPLFLVVAIAIKGESEGPVLVKLTRISNGKEFGLYKFRSMINNADKHKESLMQFNEREDGPLFKLSNDPRITRVGKVLRARRIDEIPQLINVLKGDISLVGPRPHEPQEIEQYKDHHKKVLAIKSGITGMAQVSGASDLPFEEEVKLDRFYIENWTLKHDIKILFKTLRILLFDKSGV